MSSLDCLITLTLLLFDHTKILQNVHIQILP